MRKLITALACFFLLLLPTGPVAGADLFLPAPASVAPPPANPELVVRQRTVGIDWDAFSAETDEVVRLNLFHDAAVAIVCEGANDGPAGSRIWHGRLAGETSAQITMVFDSDHLSATITTPEATYKVRPHDENWHVVREIHPGEGAVLAAAATSDEHAVWTLTNQERAENNRPGLSLDGDLVASARAHSADMAAQDYFSHTSLDERSPGDRIAATGYEARSWGENIAAGYATPQTVVDGWMHSDGHRANILSDGFCDIGVGYAYEGGSSYRHYWTQNFGRQTGVSQCPAVSDDGGNGGDGGGSSSGGGCFLVESLRR